MDTTPAADPCPDCGFPLRIVQTVPHPMLYDYGVKERTLRCDACAREVVREVQYGEA